MCQKNAFFSKKAHEIELLKPFPEPSHQTGSFGVSQRIGNRDIFFSPKVPSCTLCTVLSIFTGWGRVICFFCGASLPVENA